jgi:hypothetical protein
VDDGCRLGRRLKSTLLEAIQRLERRCSAGCLMAYEELLWIGAQAGLPVLLEGKGTIKREGTVETSAVRQAEGEALGACGRGKY